MTLPPDPTGTYLAYEPTATHRRGLKHDLVTETKRAIEHVALLDIKETTEAELRELVSQAKAFADRLEILPSLGSVGGLASAGIEDATLMERSGISGRSNPIAPPLHLRVDGKVTRGHVVYTAPYEGPIGCLHGGFVAAAFDDLMGMAQLASGIAGYTGTLTVKMRRPTPLNRRIDYEASVERVEGRKIICWGKSWNGDKLLAEAQILFIAPKDGMTPR